jgi:competence protein ComEA
MPFALRRRATLPDAAGPGRHREGVRRGQTVVPGGELHLTLREGIRARLGAALVDRMPLWLQGARVTPGRRTVLGVLLVGSAVAGVLGLRLAIASAAAHPMPALATGAAGSAAAPSVTTASAAVPSEIPSATAGATTSPGFTATAAILLVHVAGRVRHPGVVRLGSGSRVQDAITAAGGALPGSDLTTIDLAAPLVDGEQVLVARAVRGALAGTSGTSIGGSAGPAGSAGSAAEAGGTGAAIVDLNSADSTTLDSLPGVGPVLAQRILDWRSAHGRFSSVDELDEVSGIGDKLMSEIKPHVRV